MFVYALVVDHDAERIERRCDELDALLGSPRETPRADRARIAAALGGG